jgi:hypothetical protein
MPRIKPFPELIVWFEWRGWTVCKYGPDDAKRSI